jgi:hypothetical protein
MKIDPVALLSLLPKAIGWAEEQSALVLEGGQPLTAKEIGIARTVGVAHPEHIRILEVPSLPAPEDAELRQAAMAVGLLGPDMIGLTFGHGIYICEGHRTDRLVSHELRHVFQYEQAGSIADFLPTYLAQTALHGYTNAPLEIDARDHQLP